MNTPRNDFYNKELVKANGDKKETFKIFNKLLGYDNEQKLPAYDNEQQICNEFEEFFCKKVENIRENITATAPSTKYSSDDIMQHQYCSETLDCFKMLTDDDVVDIASNLPNKYCTLDPVSTKFFKECLPFLLPYIKYIINISLSE